MNFLNDESDSRVLIGTDYWPSPEAEAGQAVISFVAAQAGQPACFRILLPLVGAQRLRGISYTPFLLERHAILGATPESLTVTLPGLPEFLVPWPLVYGMTSSEFPHKATRAQMSVYTYRRGGPRCSRFLSATRGAAVHATVNKQDAEN